MDNERGIRGEKLTRVFVDEDLTKDVYDNWITDVSSTYMVVFGNTEGVTEGAIHDNGTLIPLCDYLKFLLQEGEFNEENNNHMYIQGNTLNTKTQLELVKKLYSLPPSKYETVVSSIYNKSGGFKPFYTYDEVKSRFKKDFVPRSNLHPIAASWEDEVYPTCGFISGVVADNKEGFLELIQNIPYLVRNHPDIELQVSNFLSQMDDVSFPIFLETEGGVVPERVSKENGSKWIELMWAFRYHALQLGANYSIGFTFPESKYYQSGHAHGAFLYEFETKPAFGHSMRFVVNDLHTSVALLNEKIANQFNNI